MDSCAASGSTQKKLISVCQKTATKAGEAAFSIDFILAFKTRAGKMVVC